MRTNLIATAGLALVAALSACTYDESGLPPDDNATLTSRLQRREVLSLEETSRITVTATGAGGFQVPGLSAEIARGRAAVRTTAEGVIVVEALEIDLDDVIIPAGIVSDSTYRLTDLQLRLGLQMATAPVWSPDGRHAAGEGEADLLVRATIETPEGLFPLPTLRVDDSRFQIELYLDESGEVHARLTTAVAGGVSAFLDRLALSDFAMAIDASSGALN